MQRPSRVTTFALRSRLDSCGKRIIRLARDSLVRVCTPYCNEIDMSTKKIFTVGIQLASSDAQYVSFRSKVSLLDWDIILLKPQVGDFYSYPYADFYQGKPSLSDGLSFELKECCEHWRREIKQAIETGKTVIVYLSRLEEVDIDTGQRSYSGTGRNRQTTRHVMLFNNYQSIPANLSPVATTGSSMKLVGKGAEILASYWAEFADHSEYRVLLTEPSVPTCITTRTGERSVGALFRSKASSGTLLLLPDIDFYDDDFLEEVRAIRQTRKTNKQKMRTSKLGLRRHANSQASSSHR